MSEPVELLDEDENGKGNKHEIDDVVEKNAVVDCGNARSLCLGHGIDGGAGKVDEKVAEIHLSGQKPKGGHEDIVNEAGDDLAEGGPDNYTYCQIDGIAFDGKFLECLEHARSFR